MTVPNAFPIVYVWDELRRLCKAELQSDLNLVGVFKGSFASQPTPGLLKMVNGIWVHPTPSLTSDDGEIPRVLIQKYNFRIIYLRRMGQNENTDEIMARDAVTIANVLTSKYTLPDMTNLPTNAQILWMSVKTIEFEPQEDELVATISADVRAIAVQVEVNVRVRAR